MVKALPRAGLRLPHNTPGVPGISRAGLSLRLLMGVAGLAFHAGAARSQEFSVFDIETTYDHRRISGEYPINEKRDMFIMLSERKGSFTYSVSPYCRTGSSSLDGSIRIGLGQAITTKYTCHSTSGKPMHIRGTGLLLVEGEYRSLEINYQIQGDHFGNRKIEAKISAKVKVRDDTCEVVSLSAHEVDVDEYGRSEEVGRATAKTNCTAYD